MPERSEGIMEAVEGKSISFVTELFLFVNTYLLKHINICMLVTEHKYA